MKQNQTLRLNLKIVTLYLARKLSTYEIAEELGITQAAVILHLRRAEKISSKIAKAIKRQAKINTRNSNKYAHYRVV